jgi:hypothetical protein
LGQTNIRNPAVSESLRIGFDGAEMFAILFFFFFSHGLTPPLLPCPPSHTPLLSYRTGKGRKRTTETHPPKASKKFESPVDLGGAASPSFVFEGGTITKPPGSLPAVQINDGEPVLACAIKAVLFGPNVTPVRK